ncbi:MAG: hypothetical protein CMH31_04860 [Micavibrio sp.]|nr:hypothetical protein [Micavibrio sp.]
MTVRSFFSLSIFLWLAAFICALYFNNAWQLELFGISIALIFGWSIFVLQKDIKAGWQVPQSWAHRFMGGFWLLAFLSLFVSDVINVSLMAFCFFSVMPLTFYFFTLRRDVEAMKSIGYILAGIFAILSIWALIQFFFFNMENKGAAHHPLANSNSLGALFNLAVFSALGWILIAKKRNEKVVATVLSTLYLGGLIATSSRGAFLSFAVLLPIMLICLKVETLRDWRFLMAFFIGGTLLFLSTILGEFESNRMIARVSEMVSFAQEDVSNNRFNIWMGALGVLKENWIFGIGIGMFFLHYNEYRIPEELKGVYHAHSDPLQFGIELGVLGPILFYAFLMAVLVRTIKTYRVEGISSDQRVLLLAPFFGLSAVTLHSHVTFNFYNLSILYGCGLLLAVWYLTSEQVLRAQRKQVMMPTKTSYASGLLLIILPFLFLGGLFLPYLASEHLVNSARQKMIKGDLESFSKDIQLANKLSRHTNYRSNLLAVTVPLTLLEEARAEMDAERTENVVKQALYYLENAIAINPRSAAALYYMGQLKELAPAEYLPEMMKTSEEYYKEALRLDLLHIGARMELADILMLRGDKKEALKLLEAGYRFQYKTVKVVEYYQKMAFIYLGDGNMDRYQHALKKLMRAQERFGGSNVGQESGETPSFVAP